MRTISIREHIESLVRAIPDVYLSVDPSKVQLVPNSGSFDIVFIEDEEFEVLLGEAWLNSDLELTIDIFE